MERQYSVFSPMVQAVILSLFVGGVAGYFIRIAHEDTLRLPSTQPAPPAQSQRSGGGGGMASMMAGMMGGRGGGPGAAQANGMTVATLVRNIDTVEAVQGAGLTAAQQQRLAPILKSLKAADKITEKDAPADLDKINAILTQSQKDALQKLQPARGGRGGGMGGGMMGGMGGGMGGGMMGGMMGGGGGPGRGPGAGGPPGMNPTAAAEMRANGGAGGGRPGGMGGPNPGMGSMGGRPGAMGGGPRGGGMGGGMPGGGMGGGMPGGGMGGMMGGGGGADPEHPFSSDRNKQALDDLLKRVHA